MSIAELLRQAIEDPETRHQFLCECAVGAKVKRASKIDPPHTRVEFCTTNFQPRDLILPTQAQFVGVVVWIPRETYERLGKKKPLPPPTRKRDGR